MDKCHYCKCDVSNRVVDDLGFVFCSLQCAVEFREAIETEPENIELAIDSGSEGEVMGMTEGERYAAVLGVNSERTRLLAFVRAERLTELNRRQRLKLEWHERHEEDVKARMEFEEQLSVSFGYVDACDTFIAWLEKDDGR